MNNIEEKFSIQPVLKTSVQTIEKFSISLINLVLFTSVDINVYCYDINGNFIELRMLTLDNSNGYNEWLNDDQYIINWVKNQLSFVDV